MSSNARWHLGQLDSLRGIAVLNVLLVHAVYWSPTELLHPGRCSTIFWAGQRGVQLFFVVSAFTLLLSGENRRDELRPTLNFFLRRLFRITPMFWLSALLAIFLYPSAAGTPSQFLTSIFYLGAFSVDAMNHGAAGSWSISNEMVFYLLMPLLSRWIKDLRASLIWISVAFVTLTTITSHLAHVQPARSEFWTFLSFPAEASIFLVGFVAYFVWKEFLRDTAWTVGTRQTISVAFLALASLLYWRMLPVTNNSLVPDTIVWLFLLLALLVHPWSLFANRFTMFMGKISFSVYLLHFYVAHHLEQWLSQRIASQALVLNDTKLAFLVYFVILITTIPLATLTWYFVEEPGIRLGRRLIDRLEHKHRRPREVALVPPIQAVISVGNSPDSQF